MPYIEQDFPIEFIDEIAWRESNSRKPIYHLHKWFARRVGSTFRALILGTFLEENPVLHYYQNTTLKNDRGDPPVILDPFMGGGTTIVEGHRLGCKMIGVDSNPLAWFITKKELESANGEQIKNEFEKMNISLKDNLLSYYKTRCKKGHKADIMYCFWTKKIECESCSETIVLHKSFVLAEPRKEWVYVCPHCGEVFHSLKTDACCHYCGVHFDPFQGTTDGRTYFCPHCGFQNSILSAVQKHHGPPEQELIAIEYYCPHCGRDYKCPDEEDIYICQRAEQEFEERKNDLLGKVVPDQVIQDGEKTRELLNYQYTHWSQLFNGRQLLCLSMILDYILKTKDQSLREFFLVVFSDCLNANNMLTIYNKKGLKLEPLFGGHHFWPPVSSVEGNVWGTSYGRGTFRNYYKKGLRASQYQRNPYEIVLSTKKERIEPKNNPAKRRIKKIMENERINGTFATTFKELTHKNTLLLCQSAETLTSIPDNSVDAVITDPPYYDNIMYSELSDFFYVWLRLGLQHDYPDIFGSPLTEKDREIVVNAAQKKGKAFYIEGMARVFGEAKRVLKESGLFTFLFQHKKSDAWAAVLEALIRAGFEVIAVYPTHGETPSGVRPYGMNYNCIVVCMNVQRMKGQTTDLKKAIDKEMRRTIDSHPDLDIRDAMVIAMGPALQVYSQNCPRNEGSKGIQEFMDSIEDIAFNSFLTHILERVPKVDRISTVYASILAKREKITRNMLDRIITNDVKNVFEEENLVKPEKNRILIVTPFRERKGFIKKKIEKGMPLTYIDAAHWVLIVSEDCKNNRWELFSQSDVDQEVLGQYLTFLVRRTNAPEWKKAASSFRSGNR